MTLSEAMTELEALGTQKQRDFNKKNGADDNQFGLKMGDLRVVAKKIKTNHALAKELWATGNLDARLLSILICKPKEWTFAELESMVPTATLWQLADWLNSYVVKLHPQKEEMRLKWIDSAKPMLQRSAWSLTSERVDKQAEGLDLSHLLDRIEAEMPGAHRSAQWTMNFTLASIGIHQPDFRARAIEIGERLGVFRDYPTPKGCTSPFAPIWINEMVSRQG